MDGYAVVANDGDGDRLVKGASLAGATSTFVVGLNQAAYIATGAKLPTGTDAVVKIEDTHCIAGRGGPGSTVRILKAVAAGANIRPVGCDTAVGDLLCGSC